jgi:hypothetical protein
MMRGEAQMTVKRDRAIDIAREMARHIDAGSSQEEISAAIRRAFAVFADLMVSGAPAEEIDAAVNPTKLSAETLFPKPDKTNS